MAFKKGESGNLKGRPKGTPNKSTEELREILIAFLSKNLPTMQRLFNELSPKDKLAFIDKVLAYSLPKPQAMQLSGELNVNQLTEEQLDLLINKALSNE